MTILLARGEVFTTKLLVRTKRAKERPYTGVRPKLEKTQARPSIAAANGVGITVSSMTREPLSQTNSVRNASSRRRCPDQSLCSRRVKRSWETVSSASAKATQLAGVR